MGRNGMDESKQVTRGKVEDSEQRATSIVSLASQQPAPPSALLTSKSHDEASACEQVTSNIIEIEDTWQLVSLITKGDDEEVKSKVFTGRKAEDSQRSTHCSVSLTTRGESKDSKQAEHRVASNVSSSVSKFFHSLASKLTSTSVAEAVRQAIPRARVERSERSTPASGASLSTKRQDKASQIKGAKVKAAQLPPSSSTSPTTTRQMHDEIKHVPSQLSCSVSRESTFRPAASSVPCTIKKQDNDSEGKQVTGVNSQPASCVRLIPQSPDEVKVEDSQQPAISSTSLKQPMPSDSSCNTSRNSCSLASRPASLGVPHTTKSQDEKTKVKDSQRLVVSGASFTQPHSVPSCSASRNTQSLAFSPSSSIEDKKQVVEMNSQRLAIAPSVQLTTESKDECKQITRGMMKDSAPYTDPLSHLPVSDLPSSISRDSSSQVSRPTSGGRHKSKREDEDSEYTQVTGVISQQHRKPVPSGTPLSHHVPSDRLYSVPLSLGVPCTTKRQDTGKLVTEISSQAPGPGVKLTTKSKDEGSRGKLNDSQQQTISGASIEPSDSSSSVSRNSSSLASRPTSFGAPLTTKSKDEEVKVKDSQQSAASLTQSDSVPSCSASRNSKSHASSPASSGILPTTKKEDGDNKSKQIVEMNSQRLAIAPSIQYTAKSEDKECKCKQVTREKIEDTALYVDPLAHLPIFDDLTSTDSISQVSRPTSGIRLKLKREDEDSKHKQVTGLNPQQHQRPVPSGIPLTHHVPSERLCSVSKISDSLVIRPASVGAPHTIQRQDEGRQLQVTGINPQDPAPGVLLTTQSIDEQRRGKVKDSQRQTFSSASLTHPDSVHSVSRSSSSLASRPASFGIPHTTKSKDVEIKVKVKDSQQPGVSLTQPVPSCNASRNSSSLASRPTSSGITHATKSKDEEIKMKVKDSQQPAVTASLAQPVSRNSSSFATRSTSGILHTTKSEHKASKSMHKQDAGTNSQRPALDVQLTTKKQDRKIAGGNSQRLVPSVSSSAGAPGAMPVSTSMVPSQQSPGAMPVSTSMVPSQQSPGAMPVSTSMVPSQQSPGAMPVSTSMVPSQQSPGAMPVSTSMVSSQQWQWESNDGSFSLYDEATSSILTEAYLFNPNGSVLCMIGMNTYKIDLSAMRQINVVTNAHRKVKCVTISGSSWDTSPASNPHKSSASLGVCCSEPQSTLSSEGAKSVSLVSPTYTSATTPAIPYSHASQNLPHLQCSISHSDHSTVKPQNISMPVAKTKSLTDTSTECTSTTWQLESQRSEEATKTRKQHIATQKDAERQSSGAVNKATSNIRNYSLPEQVVGNVVTKHPDPDINFLYHFNFSFLPAFNDVEVVSMIDRIGRSCNVKISVLTNKVSLDIEEIFKIFTTCASRNELPLIKHFFQQFSVVRPNFEWVVYDKTGRSISLPAATNLYLNSQYSPDGEASIDLGGNCAVNFSSMTITEELTGHSRHIYPLKPVWNYSMDHNFGFDPINESADWKKIEDMMLFGSSTAVMIGGCRCTVDSDVSDIPTVLIDIDSEQRCLLKREPPIKSVVHKFVVQFEGTSSATELALTAVKQMLADQISCQEIDVSSVSPVVRCLLYQLARQYCVEVSKNSTLTTIQLQGTGQVYLGKVSLELQQACVDAQKLLVTKGLNSAIQHVMRQQMNRHQSYCKDSEVPDEWQHQTETVQVFPLSRGLPEWRKVEEKMNRTMANRPIQIYRIQNKWLWQKYMDHKEMLHKKNGGQINELELFHGTRSNDPKNIYGGEEGFDMRFSAKGMWGEANYFAVNASYSDHYAYQASDGCLEMFLVKVLTGDSHECPPNSSLRKPPVKQRGATTGQVQLCQVNYDTVTGHTKGSRVYMTYDNLKTYPAYLIRYSRSL